MTSKKSTATQEKESVLVNSIAQEDSSSNESNFSENQMTELFEREDKKVLAPISQESRH